jgi:16S rRNA (guanine527-N7)-methyltransferase
MMTLHEGLAMLGVILTTEQEEALGRYLALLAKWNRTYNLTAITDPERMVTHHLLDALTVLPYLGGIARLVDVGSGAGIPGIPLAIAKPDLCVDSVESNQKKVSFQQQAKIELKLANLSVHCSRIENYSGTCDAVISRAFSSLADFIGHAGHLAARLFAMKGAYPAEEIQALPSAWRVVDSVRLEVPGLAAERHLIVLGRG